MPNRTNYAARKSSTTLTPKEIEVADVISQGFSSQDAADELFVSKRTVDFHLANIYGKLGVNNRVQMIRALEARKRQQRVKAA